MSETREEFMARVDSDSPDPEMALWFAVLTLRHIAEAPFEQGCRARAALGLGQVDRALAGER